MTERKQKRKTDEFYVKPSKHKQWRERSEKPVSAHIMTADEMEEHRRNLVQSYGCESKDITISFEKIFDENDEDRDDCLWIKYNMKCIRDGKPHERVIYTLKILIPIELKKKAEQMNAEARRAAAARRREKKLPALPAPIPQLEEIKPVVLQKPQLRRPGRIIKK